MTLTCQSCQQPIDATAEGYYYLGERVYHMTCEPKKETANGCSRCGYFVPDFDEYLRHLKKPPGSEGVCTRHAPSTAGFPVVTADCGCGDWIAKEEPCCQQPQCHSAILPNAESASRDRGCTLTTED